MRLAHLAVASIAAAPLASAAFAVVVPEPCYLLVPDSSNDRVLLLDEYDGSVINDNFLDIAAAGGGIGATPIEAIQVGDEIWVSDQIADRIWRFDGNGGYIGSLFEGQIDNVRGMEVVGDTVYLAQAGSNGVFGEGIITIDVPTLTMTGVFNAQGADNTSYWDVKQVGDELYVTNSDTGNDAIERYATDGSFLGFFAQSDGVSDFDFMQQLAITDNDTILGAGFSSPSGVYEFGADGTPFGIVAGLDAGTRGVYELGNGEILWTNGSFISTDAGAIIDDGSYRFISKVTIPAPGVFALMGLAGLASTRRRRG